MLMLVVQPVLIIFGCRLAHRMAGRTSLVVAGGFVLSGLLLTHFRASRMTEAAFAKEGMYIYLPLAVAVLFAAACVLGFRWRKSAPVHARFMLSTALLLIDPVLARIMFFYLPPPLADAVCLDADPASVVGCDPAMPFVEFARQHSRDARQSFVVAGSGSLPPRPGGYGSVTSLLVLNFLPDAAGAVHEMRSVAAPQATISACVWDYSDGRAIVRGIA
jgi:hypothetical protein